MGNLEMRQGTILRHALRRTCQKLQDQVEKLQEHVRDDGEEIGRRQQGDQRKHHARRAEDQHEQEHAVFHRARVEEPVAAVRFPLDPLRQKRDAVLKDAERAQDRAVDAPEKKRDKHDQNDGGECIDKEGGRQAHQPRPELRHEDGVQSADPDPHAEKQNEHDGGDGDTDGFQVFLLHGCTSLCSAGRSLRL